MTGPLLALLLGAALPAAAERRYRVEIAGEHVGWARLSVGCRAGRCTTVWHAALRAPADAGGELLERRIEIESGPDGAATRVRTELRGGRGARQVEEGAGPVPATLAELLLSDAAEGERRCLAVREEATGRAGEACATRQGEWLAGEVLGAPERFRARAGEPPEEVLLPGQRVRFAADPAADLPCRPPRLLGVAVLAGPGVRPEAARRFCGRAAEPHPLAAPPGLPSAAAEGKSCREKTARWLAAAAAGGRPGRHVVGVAWDGAAFVWHEWAEVRAGAGWVPVDPSFRQLPAEGPRFALSRFAPGDLAGEAEAGEAILACWGTARIE